MHDRGLRPRRTAPGLALSFSGVARSGSARVERHPHAHAPREVQRGGGHRRRREVAQPAHRRVRADGLRGRLELRRSRRPRRALRARGPEPSPRLHRMDAPREALHPAHALSGTHRLEARGECPGMIQTPRLDATSHQGFMSEAAWTGAAERPAGKSQRDCRGGLLLVLSAIGLDDTTSDGRGQRVGDPVAGPNHLIDNKSPPRSEFVCNRSISWRLRSEPTHT